MECTSSIYITSNIWKSFFCAVICIFTANIFAKSNYLSIIEVHNTSRVEFSSEYVLFILLGFAQSLNEAIKKIQDQMQSNTPEKILIFSDKTAD